MSPYRRAVSNTWWLQRRAYLLFMIREITSVFAAGYCVFLLVLLYGLGQGPETYSATLDLLKTPLVVVLQAIMLIFVLYHTITWFNLTPKIVVLRIKGERVSPLLIAGSIYGGWIVLSLVIAWLILGDWQ